MPEHQDAQPTSEGTDRATRLASSRYRRRRRLKFAATTALSVAGLAAFVLVATDVVPLRSPSPRLAEATEEISDTELPDPAVEGATDQLDELADRPLREVDHEDPLRLWIAGDSHVGMVGPALGELVEPTGVVSARVDYRVSSGLMSGGPRDWFTHAYEQLVEHDPEVVVFMAGTNDAVVWSDGAEDSYREQTASMMDLLAGDGNRIVLWVATPPLRSDSSNRGAVEVNRVFSELAAERPEVVYVDAHDLFDDGDGNYTDTVTALDGTTVVMRRSDGIHLAQAGADYMAVALFSLVDDLYDVTGHADPDNPIEWVTTSGSGCGGACGSSSGGSSSSEWTPSSPTAAPTDPDDTQATTVPDTSVSNSSVPESSVPDSTAPETTAAPTTAPETTAAPTTAPATTAAPTSAPATTAAPADENA